MPRAVWPALSLLVLAHAALAAQGVHPGPLPAPLGRDGAGAGSDYGEPDRYGAGYGHGSGADPRAAPGYGPPPGPGGSSAPRGYWQWVPLEPRGHDGYDYGRSEPAYRGHGDAYPPYGHAAPPQGFRDDYPGAFAPPAYEREWPAYPGLGDRSGNRPEGYYPAPGYSTEPPGGARDAAPAPPPAAPPPDRR